MTSATPSTATAISVTSQTDFSPRSAPSRISPSAPRLRINSGITTGSESAVTFISYRPKSICAAVIASPSAIPTPHAERLAASPPPKRHKEKLLAEAQILDGQQRRLVEHAEDHAPVEIERIDRRQDDAGGGEQRDPGVGLKRAHEGEEFADEAGGARQADIGQREHH